MLFNSISFALFLPIAFTIYWLLSNKFERFQNLFLLAASYFFYSCWDWKFLFLLIFSTLLDFFTGLRMFDSTSVRNKKIWFWISIIVNLGFLGVFKYYNFFIQSFTEGVAGVGFSIHPMTLNIILPIGISFYTFHGLSYVIDIYKDRIQPERNFIDYAVFVSFFPLLVAGPIERSTHLLPQFKQKRVFDAQKAYNGLRQILWGLFKKILVADLCAEYANTIFNNGQNYNGSTHLLGAVFFAFQIYCDFSGYSDIALGTSRLFGIELLKNFNFPYFSRDIAEFWRRWHISLSTWFRDYLYIPLGGSKVGTLMKVRNTFIIFIISGFWHGANWTFIFWGLLNAIFIIPSVIFKTNRTNLDIVAKGKTFPSFLEFLSIFATFSITVFAWIFFRAKSLTDAFDYIKIIFSKSLFATPNFENIDTIGPSIFFIFMLIVLEWNARQTNFALDRFALGWYKPFRWFFYMTICILIVVFKGKPQEFIYFQF
jgi:D-alanyl-lipoteichoic acid acyltransferase DltB (MBOAT superfamily)